MYCVECVTKMYNTNKLKKFRRFKLVFSGLTCIYTNKIYNRSSENYFMCNLFMNNLDFVSARLASNCAIFSFCRVPLKTTENALQ